MSEIASAFVSIVPSAKGFGSKLNSQVGGEVGGVGKSLGRTFGKAFVLGGSLLAAAGIGSFLKGSIEEAREAQKVGALTANVIKTTGGAANVSAKQVGDLASAISLKTGVDDEAIQSGSNLLLTFSKVANAGKGQAAVFDRATKAAVDLSASGFGDINGASKQLGKALQDPVKGVSALSKSGVTFTQQQKEQIKAMSESGNLLGAQQIVLGEVEKQVKGAAAATSTYGEKASVAFGNVKEQVGTALLPVLDSVFKLFLSQVPRITSFIDGIGPAFTRVQAFLAPFIAQAQGFFGGSGGGGGFLSGVQSVVGVLQSTFLPILQQAAATFQTVVLPAVTSLVSYLAASLFPVLQQVAGIVVGQVLPIFKSLALFLYGQVYPALVGIATSIAKSLKPTFDQLIATVQSQVLPAISKLLALFQKYQPQIQQVVLFLLKLYGGFIKLYVAVLGKVLPVLIRFVGFLVGRLVAGIVMYVGSLASGIRKAIEFGKAIGDAAQKVVAFATKVVKQGAKVLQFFADLPGKVRGFLAGLPDELQRLGRNIVDGLKRGIDGAAHKVTDAVKAIINKIPKKIRELMDIASPSKVTAYLGGFITEGLAVGIAAKGNKVTKALGHLLDKAKDQISQRIDDFKSLASSISDSFGGNLFSGFDTAATFVANLTKTKGNVGALISAFSTLRGFGLDGKFLAQLFADGGAPLILDLAANKDQATAAGALFGDIQSLSQSLGGSVASNVSDIGGGKTLADIERALAKTNKLLEKVPDGVGDKVNGGASGGAGRGKKGGKKR